MDFAIAAEGLAVLVGLSYIVGAFGIAVSRRRTARRAPVTPRQGRRHEHRPVPTRNTGDAATEEPTEEIDIEDTIIIESALLRRYVNIETEDHDRGAATRQASQFGWFQGGQRAETPYPTDQHRSRARHSPHPVTAEGNDADRGGS